MPGSVHVRDLGLQAGDDEAVWVRAASDAFLIVAKDDDFRQRSFLRGAPPKVIWVRLGNCRSADVAVFLRARASEIERFADDVDTALLVLARRP